MNRKLFVGAAALTLILTGILVWALGSNRPSGAGRGSHTTAARGQKSGSTGGRTGSVESVVPNSEASRNAAAAAHENRPRLRSAAQNSVNSTFEGETVDPEWALQTETAVRSKIEALRAGLTSPVDLPRLECRRQTCRIHVIGPDSPETRAYLAALQDQSGLAELADNMVLDKMLEVSTDRPNGEIHARIFLQFRR